LHALRINLSSSKNYFVCVLIMIQKKKKALQIRESRGRTWRKATACHREAGRQAVRWGREAEMPYVPGGQRVDEGEQHLELAATVGGEACVLCILARTALLAAGALPSFAGALIWWPGGRRPWWPGGRRPGGLP
jgi:hypothetical protein